MRPYFLNEILKLDTENLLCVVCYTPIYKWNDMFQHLKDKHQIELDLAYRKVIPFNLGVELKCALCSQLFINYMLLDGHMNSHYNNYVCGDCGDTFLTAPRLKSHMKIHLTGKYPCEQCGKVFKLEHYKKKHEAVVHKLTLYYKCAHCGMKFGSERERKNHVTEVHSDKVKIITCELCGKTFNWRHYFVSHMRKTHSHKKHACPNCEKRFVDKSDLDGHIAAKHNGVKKFQCTSCDRKYSSRPGLMMHLKKHKTCALAIANQSTEVEYVSS
ncbi:hypothetical protein O3G_MSEX000667 [Manduca sexta]|nr:hypothetical protein O3G_MSEX000667 [Manduca sexta]